MKYASEVDNSWTVCLDSAYCLQYVIAHAVLEVYSYSGQVLATFTSNIRRVLKDNSLPTLSLAPSIRDEDERQFIILLLLYSETKRLNSLKKVCTCPLEANHYILTRYHPASSERHGRLIWQRLRLCWRLRGRSDLTI